MIERAYFLWDTLVNTPEGAVFGFGAIFGYVLGVATMVIGMGVLDVVAKRRAAAREEERTRRRFKEAGYDVKDGRYKYKVTWLE